MEQFTIKVLKIISSIPSGKVMTYGQIAWVAGKPKGARQVARILHSMSEKYNLPWHRVVNSKGTISLKGSACQLQRNLLEAEGVVFSTQATIDLTQYAYQGDLSF